MPPLLLSAGAARKKPRSIGLAGLAHPATAAVAAVAPAREPDRHTQLRLDAAQVDEALKARRESRAFPLQVRFVGLGGLVQVAQVVGESRGEENSEATMTASSCGMSGARVNG